MSEQEREQGRIVLKITPPVVKAAYEFLVHTEPFNKWNLPASEDVRFRVGKPSDLSQAWCDYDAGTGASEIGVSSKVIEHTLNLIQAVAHEMIHLHQFLTKMDTPKVMHNKAFVKLAERVCKAHGWDSKLFAI